MGVQNLNPIQPYLAEKCLIWTRSLVDWAQDEELLRGFGSPILHLPCIEMVPLLPEHLRKADKKAGRLEYSEAPAFVFTSPHAVEFAVKIPAIEEAMTGAYGIFAVGPKTDQALKSHGFSGIVPQNVKDAESLATALPSQVDRSRPVILPGPKIRAYDIEMFLLNRGYKCQKLDLYETLSLAKGPDGVPLTPAMVDSVIQNLEGVVFFASASAVRGFVEVFEPSQNRLSEELDVVAIGDTTAKALAPHFNNVQTAPRPEVETSIEVCGSLL